jgi:hypothetical protein
MSKDTEGQRPDNQPPKAEGSPPVRRQPADPQVHRYNNPNIGPIEFLEEVMRASHVPMVHRLDCAKFLSKLELPHPMDRPPEYTIHIEGELIANPTGNELTTMDGRRFRSRITKQ